MHVFVCDVLVWRVLPFTWLWASEAGRCSRSCRVSLWNQRVWFSSQTTPKSWIVPWSWRWREPSMSQVCSYFLVFPIPDDSKSFYSPDMTLTYFDLLPWWRYDVDFNSYIVIQVWQAFASWHEGLKMRGRINIKTVTTLMWRATVVSQRRNLVTTVDTSKQIIIFLYNNHWRIEYLVLVTFTGRTSL